MRADSAPALLFAIVLGLLLGSFYTALASRILYYVYGPGRKDDFRWKLIFTRPSHCDACEAPIRSLHLIPLFGYLLVRGKCPTCGAKIGTATLLGEVFPAILFPLLLVSGVPPFSALCIVFFCGHLYTAMVTDFHYFLLDYENTIFLYLFAGASFFERTGLDWELMKPWVWTTLGALVVFLILFAAARGRGLGFGDVIMAPALALAVGFPWILVVFQAAALGGIVFALLVMKDRRAPIPFGAFMAGAVLVMLPVQALWKIFRG